MSKSGKYVQLDDLLEYLWEENKIKENYKKEPGRSPSELTMNQGAILQVHNIISHLEKIKTNSE